MCLFEPTTSSKIFLNIPNWLPPGMLAIQAVAMAFMRRRLARAWKQKIIDLDKLINYTIRKPTFDPSFTMQISGELFLTMLYSSPSIYVAAINIISIYVVKYIVPSNFKIRQLFLQPSTA